MAEPPEHVARNHAFWNQLSRDYAGPGREDWEAEEPRWGIWRVPESEVGLLPSELEGKDAIELGCGTAYVSAWLARRGARPVGLDNSEAQLETARRYQREFGVEFPLLHGNAEEAPFPDAGFDLAISEYGASIWCDPFRWIPEAARLLRPYFGMHRFEFPDDDAVEFHLPHGELIALLRANGLQVEELIEVRPPEGSTTRYPQTSLEWSRKYPCEEVWRARKVA